MTWNSTLFEMKYETPMSITRNRDNVNAVTNNVLEILNLKVILTEGSQRRCKNIEKSVE